MSTQTSSFFHIALSFLPGVGPIQAKQLIAYCGSAEAVFKERKNTLLKIPGIGPKTIYTILNHTVFEKAERESAFIEKNDIDVLLYSDQRFPNRLSHCYDAPLLLYQKGCVDLNASRIIAMVGTRKATHYGTDFIQQFMHDIAQQSYLMTVSGLALGIDGCVHRQSIEHNLPTISVLGHGLHTIYPANHKALARRIYRSNGALLSECNTQEKIVPANFPRRNRIIAGMADATIVIESTLSGGAVITANIANSYHREVFALPGKYNQPTSKGCNFLLKTHKAHLIESAHDFLYQMGWIDQKETPTTIQKEFMMGLTESEQKIMDALSKHDTLTETTLVHETNYSRGLLATTLLDLELKGLIRSLPGKKYTIR